MHSVW